MTIIIFGDSITNRADDQTGGGWTSRLWSKIYSDFSQKYAEGVVLSKHSVLELGIGGDDILGIENRWESEYHTRVNNVDNIEEIIVGIAVGINDSRLELDTGKNHISIEDFTNAYIRVLDKMKILKLKVFIVGLTPVDENKVNPCLWIDPPTSYQNDIILKYNEVLVGLAKKYKHNFVDVYSILRQQIEENEPISILSDGLHPNADGHELIAQQAYRSIKSML